MHSKVRIGATARRVMQAQAQGQRQCSLGPAPSARMASAQAAPRRRARAPQETTAATDAHVQVIALSLVSKASGIKCACKRRHATPKFFLFDPKKVGRHEVRVPASCLTSSQLLSYADSTSMQDPSRSDSTKRRARTSAALHTATTGHTDDLNPLCLSGSRIPRPTMCMHVRICVLRSPPPRTAPHVCSAAARPPQVSSSSHTGMLASPERRLSRTYGVACFQTPILAPPALLSHACPRK